MTALWYIAQALGVLLNAAIIQIPMALVYQFFFYFLLMLLVTATFMAINCRTCASNSTKSGYRKDNVERVETFEERAIPKEKLAIS